ncbi:MAG: hypothetical protein F7B20_06335 [Aeropyrum sp.]|nr:hypothetical protein [Aeropyrum sp.]MCE4616720.1 hypothetical protein [Aeropyrum sp.]
MEGGSPKRILAEKLIMTAVFALVGVLVVIAGYSRESLPIMIVGLVIVALAPFISLAVVLARLSRSRSRGRVLSKG